jgi:hypothetical protein
MWRPFALLLVGVTLFLFPSAGWSLDLATVPRQIHKHPKYRSEQPKFGLLVFGPNAEARVWVVIDGDTLYVDRNGNGDLTEPDERFDLDVSHLTKETRDDAKTLKSIMLHDPKQKPELAKDDQPILSCELRVTWFHVFQLVPTEGSYQEKSWTKNTFDVAIFANGCNEFARAEFGDSPDEAAVVSFLGPKTFKYDCPEEPVFQRGEGNYLRIAIYCEGIQGKSVIDHDFVPASIHPVAEIECPSRFADRPPVRIRAELTHRC